MFCGTAIDDVENLLINNNRLNQTVLGNQTVGGEGNMMVAQNYDDDYDGIGADGGGGGIDANFDIPGTIAPTQDFYTQNGGGFETQMPGSQFSANMMLDGDNLIEAPEQVNALSIEYAKKAKNIDAKKLKLAIWELVCVNSNDKVSVWWVRVIFLFSFSMDVFLFFDLAGKYRRK